MYFLCSLTFFAVSGGRLHSFQITLIIPRTSSPLVWGQTSVGNLALAPAQAPPDRHQVRGNSLQAPCRLRLQTTLQAFGQLAVDGNPMPSGLLYQPLPGAFPEPKANLD